MNQYHYELYVRVKSNGAIAKFEDKIVDEKSYKDVFDTVITDHYRSDNVLLDQYDMRHYYEVYVWEIDRESKAPLHRKAKLYINGTSFNVKGE